MGKVLIALGGNALGNTPAEQISIVKSTAKSIVDLINARYEVIVSHGNGPQIGIINQAMDYAANSVVEVPCMPFAECGAMSQGYIGYHLQQAIGDELRMRGIDKDCVTIITQTVVDRDDPAFDKPTKPVGVFYTREAAEKIAQEKGFIFIDDAGRGYRRVVPSPKPVEIVESKIIQTLVNSGVVVIAVGGGGIPVIKKANRFVGVDAVIDKDHSSSKLALQLGVDVLLILTAVEHVAINFNTQYQQALSSISVEEAERYIAQSQFAKGSMLPKIEACLDFVKNSDSGCKAIITSLPCALDALNGRTGTVICN